MLYEGSKALWVTIFILVTIPSLTTVSAEDGYDLWLRYRTMDDDLINQYTQQVRNIVTSPSPSPMMKAAVVELQRGLQL